MNYSIKNIKQFLFITSIILVIKYSGSNILSQNTNYSSFENSYGITADSLKNLQKKYIRNNSKSLRNKFDILNGTEYKIYFNLNYSHPFLFTKHPNPASIIINGQQINDLRLNYDTYKDELVYNSRLDFENYYSLIISLNKDIIDGFILNINNKDLEFKKLVFTDSIYQNMQNGFYEILYDYKSSFIIKHKSELKEVESIDTYNYKPEKYIKINKAYLNIKGRRSFLKAFGNKSKEIKKFLKSSGILFRRATNEQIVNVLKYYDSIRNKGL